MAGDAKKNKGNEELVLAQERTFLSYERTLMSWIRTATSLITLGFAIYKYFQFWNESEPDKHAPTLFGARHFGLIMIGIGVMTLVIATFQHRAQLRELKVRYSHTPFSLAFLLATAISIVGVLAFIAACFGQ